MSRPSIRASTFLNVKSQNTVRKSTVSVHTRVPSPRMSVSSFRNASVIRASMSRPRDSLFGEVCLWNQIYTQLKQSDRSEQEDTAPIQANAM